ADTQCSTSVLPSRVSSCLGVAAPKRLPAPPPSTTATIRVTVTSGTLLGIHWRGYPRDTGGRSLRWENGVSPRGRRMTAEELAANQRAAGLVTDPVARDVARWAASRQMTPVAMAAIALGFGVIAAGWLTTVGMRAEVIAFGALAAASVVGRAARLLGGWRATAVTDWGLAVCAVLTEFAVYAGIAGSASAGATAASGAGLTGPLGERLSGT